MDGLANRSRSVRLHWNRIPDSVRELIAEIALERPDLTPRELAWHITDTHDYFVSESSVYRMLKDHDLFTGPQFMVMSASDTSQHPTRDTGSTGLGGNQDDDETEITQPATSRLDWRSDRQESVS